MILTQKNLVFLWSLFFFFYAFISFPPFHHISNVLIFALFFIALFKGKGRGFTYTTWFFIFITAISILNQIILSHNYLWDKDSWTLIGVLMAVIAAEKLFIPNKIFDLILLNSLPVIILFLLGGISFENGRISTEFLNPNIRGIFYFGGFSAAIYYIGEYHKINLRNILILISTSAFLVLSGSRKNILLLGIAILINFISVKRVVKTFKNPFYRLFFLISFFTIVYFITTYSYDVLGDRFGQKSTISKIQGEDEYSAQERISFIESSFKIANNYPLGIGYGNIKEGLEKYGSIYFKTTQNPHSLMAELLISTGYLGLVLFILYALYIFKISKKEFRKWYFIILFIIVSFFSITLLNDKIFWVLLVFLEREIKQTPAIINISPSKLLS